MIIKFFRQRRRGAIEYLTDPERHSGLKILRGAPGLTRKIYEALPYAQRYCTGVIAEDGTMDEGVQEQVMNAFEAVLGAGISPDEWDISWIRHEDRGRTELHFVVPAGILSTQRAWSPYWDKVDRPLFEILRDYCNTRYGLADPLKASRRVATKGSDTLRKAGKRQGILEAIDEWAAVEIEAGRITCRQDLIAGLEARGFEITRVGAEYISIRGHDMERPVRLRGAWYASNFTSLGECAEACRREGGDRGPQRLGELTSRLRAYIGPRAARNAARAKHGPVGMDYCWNIGAGDNPSSDDLALGGPDPAGGRTEDAANGWKDRRCPGSLRDLTAAERDSHRPTGQVTWAAAD
ncbi:MAG: relaxase/mobilization nuclease domain-containing protein [Syntrophorhabdales bacterium]|jgi:hypothetical protein